MVKNIQNIRYVNQSLILPFAAVSPDSSSLLERCMRVISWGNAPSVLWVSCRGERFPSFARGRNTNIGRLRGGRTTYTVETQGWSLLLSFFSLSRSDPELKRGRHLKRFSPLVTRTLFFNSKKNQQKKIALVSIPAAGIGWGWRSSVTVGQNSVGEVLAHQQLEWGKGVPGSMNWLDFRCQLKAGYSRRFQRYPTIRRWVSGRLPFTL